MYNLPVTRKPSEFSRRLGDLLAAEGLSVAGVSVAEDLPRKERAFSEFLARGFAGSMSYLHHQFPKRYRPGSLVEGSRSIVFVAMSYYRATPERPTDRSYGRVARYARGRDYHKVIGNRLRRVVKQLRQDYPGESFRSFTDATPLSERVYASRGGVGFHGRNTLLINPSMGSWFLLGEILTSMQLPPTTFPATSRSHCPPGCRRCLHACPTNAIYAPHRFDARRCISYLTIEHKGSIDPDLREQMQDWLFGCDRCQEVCPLNRGVTETQEEDFLTDNAGAFLPLGDVLALESDDAVRTRLAGSALLRAKRRGLVRNACIVAANTGALETLPQLRRLTADADHVVREHAAWAVQRLSG
ncbi:MAG: tRNA epoxyqueuosine(34) reductase QueG [Spirochaetaceae bacterium]